MTAIFAYVTDKIAFVAADTKRADPIFTTTACKITRWSETVLIAQTGHGEGLQRLVGEMLAKQHNNLSLISARGAAKLFKTLAPNKLQEEIKRLRRPIASAIHGTLIVAGASHNGQQGTLMTLDWKTQAEDIKPGPIYADGTDQTAFMQIANMQFQKLFSNSAPGDIGAWGVACIEDAVAHSPAVGWPADLCICRIDGAIPVTLQQRVITASAARHPIFSL